MRKTAISIECTVCKKDVEIKLCRKETFKYCSIKCSSKGRINHRPTHYKGGKLRHKGYIYVLSKEHPNRDRDGYVTEHRLVIEKKIGRFLTRKEVVHHINGIRGDNRIENLELHSSQSEHMKEHYPKGMNFQQKRLAEQNTD